MGRGSPPAVLALCLLFCWTAIATAKSGWRRQPTAQTAQWGSARRLPNDISTAPSRYPFYNSLLHGHHYRHRAPWAATGRGGRAMAMAGGGGPWAATGSGGGGGGSWTVAGGGRGGPWAVTSAGGGSQWTVTGGGRHPQYAMNGRPAVGARRLPWPAAGTGWAHTGHHGRPDDRRHHPWNFLRRTHPGGGVVGCRVGERRYHQRPDQRPEQRPVEPEQRPVEPEQRPVEPEQRPVEPEQRPVEPEQRPIQPAEDPVVPDQEGGSGFSPDTVPPPEKTDCPEGAVFLDGQCVCRDPTPFLDTILERCVDTRPAIY